MVQAKDSLYSVQQSTVTNVKRLMTGGRPTSLLYSESDAGGYIKRGLFPLALIFQRSYHFLLHDMCSLRFFAMMEYLYTHSFFTQQPRVLEPTISSHAAGTDASPDSQANTPSDRHDRAESGKDTDCDK